MSQLKQILQGNRNAVMAVIVVVAVVISGVGVRALVTADDRDPAQIGFSEDRADGADSPAESQRNPAPILDEGDGAGAAAEDDGTSDTAQSPDGAGAAISLGGGARAGSAAQSTADGPAGSADRTASAGSRSGGTPLPGVTEDEITVVYYWKGDRTRTSPYLHGTGAEANVDEAEAFRNLIDYVNRHPDGGGTIMGFPFNLHGRRLKGIVVEAGQDPESYAAAAEQITAEIRPFAAIAAHGSISTYLCPALADAGIHNFATYDLGGGLAARTGGYCLPGSISWERQVALSQAYLLAQQRADTGRVYGVVYTEYPGLVESAPRMIQRLEAAGLKVAATATLSASLSTAQQQAPNVVARMRAAGVNTIVMPDAGTPLNFTHAAQAQAYSPDYYVWPCSGQDTASMARLFNATQWDGAAGLTCYDEQFSSDLTHNGQTRSTEWYAAYQETAPGQEPPAPTPFVYAALLPLVVGITEAGPNLTLERFRAGLDGFRSYRYDAIEGRTGDPANMLLSLGLEDRSFMADVMKLRFDASKRAPGATTPGTYAFPERRRYAEPSEF